MIIVCPTCSTRLQVEDRTSSKPLSVRCPKCSKTISLNAVSPVSDQGALAVGGSPSTSHARYEPVNTAPPYEGSTPSQQPNLPTNAEETLRLLMDLLSRGGDTAPASLVRPAWNKRKVLVCTHERYRDRIAASLSANNYQVFVAQETRQAVESLRNKQIDIVLLESEFDLAEQGAAFVVREINILRPPQRRRLFFALLSPSLRTMDAHAAFLNNVNAIVNFGDVDQLPRVLDLSLRDYNELYKDFNAAFNLLAL